MPRAGLSSSTLRDSSSTCVRNERLTVHHGTERGVGGVYKSVTLEENMRGRFLGLHQLGDGEELYPLPLHVKQLTPCGDAMEIAGVFELFQCHELRPIKRDGFRHQPMKI